MSKKEEVFELPEKSDDAMDIPVEKLKAPRKKREMSDEAKAKMLANLAKGREARKAKAELAKSAKAEPLIGVGQSPPQSATPTVSGRKQISERSEANQIVEEKPKAKRTPKPKEEPKVDLNAERERLALINKMVGKEKTNPKPRAEPKLSDTTKETIKAERVKTVEDSIGVRASPSQSATPKVNNETSGRKQISEQREANQMAPVVPSKPEIVHVVKRNFSKPIW